MTITTDTAAADPIWRLYAEDRPAWWRPLAPNPWPGSRRAYPCPWGCNGTGHLPHFQHIANGACFGCKGRGWLYGRLEVEAAAPAQQQQQPRRWRRDGCRIIPA
jgi:hypothetical protein